MLTTTAIAIAIQFISSSLSPGVVAERGERETDARGEGE
jgi:hypothetical protein